MAGSDEETVEVGMNEERRLCGLAGDDDEDNMDEDRTALFGATADDAIPVDGDGEHVEEPPAPDSNSAKLPRPSTLLSGLTMRNYSRKSMVRRSGMELDAFTTLRSTLLSLVVALVTYPGIF